MEHGKHIGEKIRKIMHEGIKGKKVRVNKAAAVAYSMIGKMGEKAKRIKR